MSVPLKASHRSFIFTSCPPWENVCHLYQRLPPPLIWRISVYLTVHVRVCLANCLCKWCYHASMWKPVWEILPLIWLEWNRVRIASWVKTDLFVWYSSLSNCHRDSVTAQSASPTHCTNHFSRDLSAVCLNAVFTAWRLDFSRLSGGWRGLQ